MDIGSVPPLGVPAQRWMGQHDMFTAYKDMPTTRETAQD
jgi:hypothetical protein